MKNAVSVVIITHNRPEEAKAAVLMVINQSLKPYEIVFIDNASNPPVDLSSLNFQKLTTIRFEKLEGTSFARNYAIKISQGDYVAFIDDDCVPTVNWLKEINEGIIAGYEIMGGSLLPKFMAIPPEWLKWSKNQYFWWGVGVGNTRKKEIWGGNMVFQKEVFKKIGLFNPIIGPQGGKHLGFEDIDLVNRGKKCCRVMFLPKAIVYHRVTAERMTIRYIAKWSFYKGKTEQIIAGRKALNTMYELLLAFAMDLNPKIIKNKSSRIKRISWMAELLGRLL